MDKLTLTLTVPGSEPLFIPCSRVGLTARDDEKGEGGGSMSILAGHIPAVIALEPGSVVAAFDNEAQIAGFTVSGGFASAGGSVVSVICESAERNE